MKTNKIIAVSYTHLDVYKRQVYDSHSGFVNGDFHGCRNNNVNRFVQIKTDIEKNRRAGQQLSYYESGNSYSHRTSYVLQRIGS